MLWCISLTEHILSMYMTLASKPSTKTINNKTCYNRILLKVVLKGTTQRLECDRVFVLVITKKSKY